MQESHFSRGCALRQLLQQPAVTSRCRTALSGLVTQKKNTAKGYPDSPEHLTRMIQRATAARNAPSPENQLQNSSARGPQGDTPQIHILWGMKSCTKERENLEEGCFKLMGGR